MGKSRIGVYGLGVMGQSIALNLLNHGYHVSVYNKFENATQQFMKEKVTNQKVEACFDLQTFVESLERPRTILLMVTAGKVVDQVIDELVNYLEKGDILIDGGNTYFKDTIRRYETLKSKGIHFIGMGVSGGEMGALNGPSLMPSGDRNVCDQIEDILMTIAAKTHDGEACCTYIGTDGSGHYVKMVHNGIEYADIQIISEAYLLMRQVARLSIEQIQKIFEKWNEGRLKSYLIEITAQILKRKDEETGEYLIDMIQDKAGQKGTGKWTGMEGLDIGAAIPTITESVFARFISSMKEQRVRASELFDQKYHIQIQSVDEFVDNLEMAVYASKIAAYAQGFALLKQAAEQYGWQLNYGKIAMIWREGCIIRADFLEKIKLAFEEDDMMNLMMSEQFREIMRSSQKGWREIIKVIVESGIYAPCLMSALSYFDGMRAKQTSANLIQAQRDYFGAHTYERIDKEGIFHTVWEK